MNYYEFLKFGVFSIIYKSFLIYFNSKKSFTASALRKADVSRSTDPVQVKPDQWDPPVIESGLTEV